MRQFESCIPTSVTLLNWPVGSKQVLLPQALLLLLLTAACTDRTHGTFRVEGSRSSRLISRLISKLRSCTRLIDSLPLTRLLLCCSVAYAVALAAALSIESPFMHVDNLMVGLLLFLVWFRTLPTCLHAQVQAPASVWLNVCVKAAPADN